MTDFIVDASVVLKWIVPESHSGEALMLRRGFSLGAPDLIIAESANACWAKAHRRQITGEEATLAARIIQQIDIELVSMRSLIDASMRLALKLAHPVYDCAYLALALERGCAFVTADEKLVGKVKRSDDAQLAGIIRSLPEAAASL